MNRPTDIVTVFPEEPFTDADGNTYPRPSAVGVVCRAVVQPVTTSESDVATAEKLRLRLVGWQGELLGARSQVEWENSRYAIDGEPMRYNGSRRTRHVDYHLVRLGRK